MISHKSDQPVPEVRTSRATAPTIVGLVLLALVLWPLMWINPSFMVQGSSAEDLYHIPTIEQFARQLPAPDYSDYASATAPGYHTLLAVPRSLGMGYSGIRMLASLWTFAFVGVLLWVCARRFGFGALLLVLPLAASNYVLFPGIWLLPDNAGWLGVLVILLLCVQRKFSHRRLVLMGVLLLGLVFVRQVHIWMAAPIWLSAWIGSDAQTPTFSEICTDLGNRTKRAAFAVLCTLPAFVLLAWFARLWGGLVPPTFQGEHAGVNPATPGFVLLQIAILSIFFLPLLLRRAPIVWREHGRMVLLALALGLALGLTPASSYSLDAGRYGAWWNLIKQFPVVADRSPVFVLGSVIGAASVVIWCSMCSRRDQWILGVVLLAFVCSQTMNQRSWQRYHEPLLLVLICLILARSCSKIVCYKRLLLGSVLLASILASITWYQLGDVVPRGETDPRVDALRAKNSDSTPTHTP
ncbi:MAG: hypothetical protein KC996_06340 [Phycisphaerales bacterium]|nr:hypothetical protein [Phycisphaerales bacterium]